MDKKQKTVKNPRRSTRKMVTLLHVLKYMPATFSVMMDRVRTSSGKKISPSLLTKYLDDMVSWGIVRKDHNLYVFDSRKVDRMYSEKSYALKMILSLAYFMPITVKIKKQYGSDEEVSTYSEVMGWKILE